MRKYGVPARDVKVTVSDEKAKQKIVYPKGFDITLQEIFEQYEIDTESLDKIKARHAKKTGTLCYAFIGRNSFYRRAQIEACIGKIPKVEQDFLDKLEEKVPVGT